MAPPNDGLLHELIGAIRENTDRLALYREDMNRAMLIVYQRITEIERKLVDEAKERPQRQKELDAKLKKQDDAIAGIDARLDKQDSALENQDKTLSELFDRQEAVIRAQRWRGWALILITIGVIALAAGVWNLARVIGGLE